jgi:hypothetical protein
MGVVLSQLGQLEEAHISLKRALDIRIENYGITSILTTNTQRNFEFNENKTKSITAAPKFTPIVKLLGKDASFHGESYPFCK